jgi:ribonuclease P protein component
MLNRKYRATRIDIESAIKTGISISGMVLYAKISKQDRKSAGFAIVVSKKVEKTSVGRHAIKRKISAYLESQLTKMNPEFKKTLVFFVKDAKSPNFYTQAYKDLVDILKKADFFA